jgi:hypothetical protein
MPWKVEVILRKDGQTIKSPTFASREEAEKELQEIKGNIYQGGAVNRSWLALAAGGDILAAHITGQESRYER